MKHVKKKYRLPVTWELCGLVEIEAETLEEAVNYFNDNTWSIKIPTDADYVDGSFQLSSEEFDYLMLFNKDTL